MFPRIIAKGTIILFSRRRVAIFRGEGIIRGNTVLQLVCIISGTAFVCFVNPCTALLPSHGQFDQFIPSQSRPLNRRKSITLSSAVSKKIISNMSSVAKIRRMGNVKYPPGLTRPART